MNTFVQFAQLKVDPGSVGVHRISDANAALAGALNTIYAWAGIVAVIVIVVAGYYYVTSSGDAMGLKRAKQSIIGACVGLIIVLMAFVITQFILGRF